MTDEEYDKELAEIREQFNKLKMMIEESQRIYTGSFRLDNEITRPQSRALYDMELQA